MSWYVGNQKVLRRFKGVNEEIANTKGNIEEKKAKILLYKFLRENPSFAATLITGEELFPFQHMAVKGIFESDYSLLIWGRGMSKTWSCAMYAILDAILHQGVHIGIISKSFRQSKMIFRKIEDISKNPKAGFLAQCITKVSKQNDEWTIEMGRSKITALPLGDGEKLRGFRFQRMLIDELLLMPEKIINEVITPFLSVVNNPIERQRLHDLETKLIETGEMTEEERYRWPNNKLIGLSSASYKFEYLYKLYQQYETLIMNPETKHVTIGDTSKPPPKATRFIMHMSYDCAPEQLYDQTLIQQAKATMSQAQFDREFGAVFTDDSSGFFRVSKMEACTIPDGEGQCVEVAGDPDAEYIVSFDPAWSESESSDDFSMNVIKLDKEKKIGTVVHSYAVHGVNLKNHIKYFHYLLTHFNVVSIVGDYNGGVQFTSACNESELFKKAGIELKTIEVDLDDMTEYESALREVKTTYNKDSYKMLFLRKPSSFWIRSANELLQAHIDHKKIWFAGAALNDDFGKQLAKNIPLDSLKYLSDDASNAVDLSKIDFLENLKTNVDQIKVQCALIQVTTSPQGTQSFDLPTNLKKTTGANKARKDSYSALVLGNWMMKTYYDMMDVTASNTHVTFTPRFVK